MNTNRRIELIAALAATLALPVCSIPTEGFTVTVTLRESFVPSAQHRTWWTDVQACSSTRGDFHLVRWYRAAEIRSGGKSVQGIWQFPHDVTVVRGAEAVSSIVRHEMLHELLRGDADHKNEAWVRCDLVDGGS